MQQAIQRLDYCPILDFHYRLLAKSKYNIDKHYCCVFDDIDTPTEKERAEIRELNSRTDMNYIQAGVISPDEVRGVIRADEKSGYNALAEEMEGEGLEADPFGDIDGGSETEQSPFNQDEWKEGDPRKENGQFGEGSGTASGKVEKSSKRDKIKNRERKEVKLPKEEYAQVMHELNTNLTKEQRKKKQITKEIGSHRYLVENKGFNEYRVLKKEPIDDID